MTRPSLRLPPQLAQEVDTVWRERGFTDFSAFARQAIQNEIDRDQAALDGMEQRLAATLVGLQRQIQSLSTGNQATFALLMSLIRHMLATWPEPPKEMAGYNRANLEGRMRRLLQAAAADFHNDLSSVFEGPEQEEPQ